MSDIYLRVRRNPFSATTEMSDVRLTFSDIAVYPTCVLVEDGVIVACYEENSSVKTLVTGDYGVTTTLATLVAGSAPFIELDSTNSVIHLSYWDDANSKISYNYSTDNLATLHLEIASIVYNTTVTEQQPSIISYPSGIST